MQDIFLSFYYLLTLNFENFILILNSITIEITWIIFLFFCFSSVLILLKIFGESKKTYFEKIEDIEIVRFLELGFKVKMTELSDTISVDFLSDIKKVEKLMLSERK